MKHVFPLLVLITLAACSDDTAHQHVEIVEVEDAFSAVDENTILEASDDGWRSHGRTYSEQRHSPIEQITLENVSELGLEWSLELGADRGIEVTPIVHDGIMFITATWNIVTALDAVTGETLWTHDPLVDRKQAALGCCDAVNRGVAIWGDDIFTGTIDGRLISLDALTGEVNWDINTIDKSKPYTITGAPRIVNGKVLIGNGGAEFGVRGYISAYDAQTGEMAWRFYTVPGDPSLEFENDAMAKAAETWTGEYWQAGGGGTVWDSMAYDPELNQLYIGVGNGSPWNHGIRSPEGGDNLYLSSIVALNPDNGEYIWHYQSTPAETWDYTATQHMILAELEIEGQTRKVIMQAPKNGFFYVLDRETGEFISANNYVPVTWATHIDPESGRPVELEGARYSGSEPVLTLPGSYGGHNWMPMSYSPETGLVYIPAQEIPLVFGEAEDYEYTPGIWNTGLNGMFAVLPTDVPTLTYLKAMVKGRLIAWDPVKQEAAWSVEHKGPWNGGVLSTKSNVVFQGTADAHFAAYNAATGEELWKYFTQTGIVAAPITYSIDGEQYVAVAAGWGGAYALIAGGVLPSGSRPDGGRLMVFKLGGTEELPEITEQAIRDTTPPAPIDVSKEVIALGDYTYVHNCSVCHGEQALSYGSIPSLRLSNITKSSETWRTVVLNGALSGYGMPNFDGILDEDEVEAVRAYVIDAANSERTAAFYESIGKPTVEQESQTEADSESDSEENAGG